MKTLSLALVLFLPSLALAEDGCPEDWPSGSAMHTGCLARLRLEVADKTLNETYQKLIKALPKDEQDNFPRKTLVEAQRAWISYRDKNCALMGEINGGARMWKSTYSVLCEAEATEKRTAELREMLSGL